VEVEIWEQY